jgi:dynein heavy chain
LNPKSISMGELYGYTDPVTNDFTDGLASSILSDFSKNESRVRKIIMFDGPVDSLWIENLNSVLDDTMTLCLSNGKRIKLNWDIRILFEVQDLSQAS